MEDKELKEIREQIRERWDKLGLVKEVGEIKFENKLKTNRI